MSPAATLTRATTRRFLGGSDAMRHFTVPGPHGQTLTFRRRTAETWGCCVEDATGRIAVECATRTLAEARTHVAALLEHAAARRGAADV